MRRCTTHGLFRSKLGQHDHIQHPQNGLPRITRTCPGWWKQSFWLRLWSLVWFQRRATFCHLTSSKSAWKSTPKCTWMCWRVGWSSGAIRRPVADPGCGSRTRRQPTSPKRPRLGFRRSTTTLYHNNKASVITVIRQVFAELPPALVEKACSQFRIRIKAVIEAEGSYIE